MFLIYVATLSQFVFVLIVSPTSHLPPLPPTHTLCKCVVFGALLVACFNCKFMSSLRNFICKQSRVFYLNIALTKSNNNFVCVLIYKYISEASFMPSNNNTNNCREDSPGRECRVQSDRRGGAGLGRRASATRCKRQLWHETGATSWQSEVSGRANVPALPAV